MVDVTGKSYNETAPRGADVDLTEQRALEAVRAAKRDGTIGEAFGSDSGPGSIGERVSDGVAKARDTISDTVAGLYDEASSLVRGRTDEVAGEGRTMMGQLVDQRPVQLFLGAALVGFLFGKFG